MTDYLTLRIYFEYGNVFHRGSWIERFLGKNEISYFLLKEAKKANLKQAIIFSISKGYLKNKSIKWKTEFPDFESPQCFEVMDLPEKIIIFINENKKLLHETEIILIKNEAQIIDSN